MRLINGLTASWALLALCAGHAAAALPPASEAAKAQAEEARARSAWQDKVAAYELCRSQDQVVEAYRRDQKAAGKPVPAPTAQGTPCQAPGPFASPPSQKPLEAAGAHSPPGTATSPPNRKATAAETMGTQK